MSFLFLGTEGAPAWLMCNVISGNNVDIVHIIIMLEIWILVLLSIKSIAAFIWIQHSHQTGFVQLTGFYNEFYNEKVARFLKFSWHYWIFCLGYSMIFGTTNGNFTYAADGEPSTVVELLFYLDCSYSFIRYSFSVLTCDFCLRD